MEKLQNYVRIGLLRGWLDMEIYSQVYKDTVMLILDIKREYLPLKKMNNKDLKFLEKLITTVNRYTKLLIY